MNKKLLICGAIATVLLVSACVKKEAPKEDEQEVETTQTAASEPAQFENLPSAEQNGTQQVEAPAQQVVIERTQTENTTTEIRRETHEAHATTQNQAAETKPAEESKPAKAESVKVETSQAAPKATTGAAQSEDDAVAAAIAAATPALKN
ncbi:hypothetical protein [Acinetobacter sp. P8-3-8]|uniref:hypothetical protein n=1 Tax=Acinetobacter sp. P8-3-8 TaxID=1029823 RepID=UPI0002486937|nr:hypothetical protein [Acinetobacter sp. P8-3-8]